MPLTCGNVILPPGQCWAFTPRDGLWGRETGNPQTPVHLTLGATRVVGHKGPVPKDGVVDQLVDDRPHNPQIGLIDLRFFRLTCSYTMNNIGDGYGDNTGT